MCYSPLRLIALLAAISLSGWFSDASAITVLNEDIDALHINQGNRGSVRAIGAFDIVSNGSTGSGTVITDGSNNVWVLTAAHVLVDVGATGDPMNLIPAQVEFTVSNNLFSGGAFDLVDWYIPNTYDGAVVNANDIALARLDVSRANYTGSALPLFSRPTADEAAQDLLDDEEIQFVGYGSTGTGATGAVNFDGFRRLGRNRVDGFADGNAFILTTDFDVDRDDELYDDTPNDFTDRNPLIELAYELKNFGEFTASGAVEPRQVPEEDFRVPFESVMSPGDSGGAYIAGGAVAGVHSFGQRQGTSSQFTLSQGFVSVSPWVDWIGSVISQAEGGGPVTGNADAGVFIGDPTIPSIAETEMIDVGDATATFNALLTSYYAGFSLSVEDKMKLLNYLAVTNNDVLSASDVVGLVDDPSALDYASAVALIDQQLSSVWGAPTPDRAVQSTERFLVNSLGSTDVHRGDITAPTFIFGDINDDGVVNQADIDLLQQGIADGEEWADYNFDLTTDAADLDVLLAEVLNVVIGDADLDGTIAQADLDAVLLNWGQSDTGWAGGDFDGDGIVAQGDLDAVLLNWGVTTEPTGSNVPEPAVAGLIALGSFALLRRR